MTKTDSDLEALLAKANAAADVTGGDGVQGDWRLAQLRGY